MKSVIIIPTYNEKGNIPQLVKDIIDFNRNVHILIVDDNSPDGTGKIAEELAERYKEIQVIHREGKLGLATAYVEGFKRALKEGADYIFQMDADLSHNPRYIPDFLEVIKKSDLVIGSRYVNGDSVINWGRGRLMLSKMATQYVKVITGLPVTDATSGFKCFRRKVLETLDLSRIISNGYSFQIEMTFKAYKKGFRIGETPIIFEDRRTGKTKMSKKIVMEALWIVWKLQLEYFYNRFIVFLNEYKNIIIFKQFIRFCFAGIFARKNPK